jgi:putative N6-adenine-specific DNA methylase
MIAVALCPIGLEKTVSNELRKLAQSSGRRFRVTGTGAGKVRFETCLGGLYRAVLGLRCADRVLLEAASFRADNFDSLFEGVKAVRWEDYIPKGMALTVAKARAAGSALAAETSVQAVVNKAAADRLCAAFGVLRLPESASGGGRQAAGQAAELRVHIERDNVQVLLDLCGKPMFKRGYRVEGGIAPLRETVAAGLLLMSGWLRKHPLYDPFCGSGTIVTEAAMFAWDVAPGLARRFAIAGLAFADADAEKDARAELLAKADLSRIVRIFGSDGDAEAIGTAKANLARVLEAAGGAPACVPKLWFRKMEEASAPDSEGFVITNPPYGVRLLDKEKAEALYRTMAALPERFPAWKIGVLSAHADFPALFGAKAARCRKITSGAIGTYFYEFEGRSAPTPERRPSRDSRPAVRESDGRPAPGPRPSPAGRPDKTDRRPPKPPSKTYTW